MLGHSLKREAIRECKRVWKAIFNSGLSKAAYINSKEGKFWRDKNYKFDCPLCNYAKAVRMDDFNCRTRCPLQIQYHNTCLNLSWSLDKLPSEKWLEAVNGLRE
jgi:hypothetical protein